MRFARSFGICVLLTVLTGSDPAPRNDASRIRQLRSGMTPDEVRQLLGPPQRIARQILYHRYLEQWVYDAPLSVRVEFDCPRGQPSRLIADSITER
jgi:hypothetical protein